MARSTFTRQVNGLSSLKSEAWSDSLAVDVVPKDKAYRKYAAGVDRALQLFETALEEWADYISFLNKLIKALQARQPDCHTVPSKILVAKRLSQCLNPTLPSGVHQKALELYDYIFRIIGKDGLSADLALYLPGLAPTLSFAALGVRTPFLGIMEQYFVKLDSRVLRPAVKSIVLAILPALEDETAEDFERVFTLLESFKRAIRPPQSQELSDYHATGDDYFWQCFFLASITSQNRRPGALVYLTRCLPKLGDTVAENEQKQVNKETTELSTQLAQVVTNPEPGLLLRCFAAGLADEQLLIQRGYLDLLVTHLPLHSHVLRHRVKEDDLQLLIKAAAGVVIRREMSLNRRLWTWLLGPEPAVPDHENGQMSPQSPAIPFAGLTSRTAYFEDHGLQPLTQALLALIHDAQHRSAAERARPYRMCLSFMDRWEIGGLIVPEIFLPVIESVRDFEDKAPDRTSFMEVVKSASVFFDGVESGLIYGRMMSLIHQAFTINDAAMSKRLDGLALVRFIMNHFNIREEEMVTIHAPLVVLAILCLPHHSNTQEPSRLSSADWKQLRSPVLGIATHLAELIPARALSVKTAAKGEAAEVDIDQGDVNSDEDLLTAINNYYIDTQGNADPLILPPGLQTMPSRLLHRASELMRLSLSEKGSTEAVGVECRLLLLLLTKSPRDTNFDAKTIFSTLQACLSGEHRLEYGILSTAVSVSTQLYTSGRVTTQKILDLVPLLVRHAWAFLSPATPKHHVETVRSLWQLQTALGHTNRDIEAALCELITQDGVGNVSTNQDAETGRRFAVLWAQTLQDNPSGADRRAPKTPNGDLSAFPRLAGSEYYGVMLTRPAFLMLDALSEERTQLFMAVKTWLNSLVGVERLLTIFATKFTELGFLFTPQQDPAMLKARIHEHDLDLCVYYLTAVSSIFRWAPDTIWSILATKLVNHADFHNLNSVYAAEEKIAWQRYLLDVCLNCLSLAGVDSDSDETRRMARLTSSALTLLNQLLQNPYASQCAKHGLSDMLIERLEASINSTEPFIQVLLLDAIFASLKLADEIATQEKDRVLLERARTMSITGRPERASSLTDRSTATEGPPRALLKVIQAGLKSASSRAVLDSWISFLTECLPFYTDTIFQVLIPLVETFCFEIDTTFTHLHGVFESPQSNALQTFYAPENCLISFLNGLEQILARAHDRILVEESKNSLTKAPEQPQGFFGNMVSGVFATDAQQATRSATANDRLTVLLAFQDAVRICFKIWSWGQGNDASLQDATSAATFAHTSLRLRNRARRLLEHLFAAETLECLETVLDIWRTSLDQPGSASHEEVFRLLPALDGSRPRHSIPAIFNSIYSRTSPAALDPSRKSNMTVNLQDTDVAIFLIDYAKSCDDDAMDEIWQDCMAFVRDILTNPFPHRQILSSLLEFTAILGEKVDNTNFGEQRKMRRELGDLFLRLLTALFTTRPMSFTDPNSSPTEKKSASLTASTNPQARAEDVIGTFCNIVPNLPKILVENDRVVAAAAVISTQVIGPALRAKAFPNTFSKSMLLLLQELSRLSNNQKNWKKDIADAFNDPRFFSCSVDLVEMDWLPLLRHWTITDGDGIPELLSRITAPSTAGIVFGVGATSARLEADRRTQLSLRRIATLISAAAHDTFASEVHAIVEKLVELLGATSTSSPSSTTRAEVFLVCRVLVLKISAIHLSPLWPIINAELHIAIASVVLADHDRVAELYNNASILQACKLLDLLICVAPDDFQLHEWLFVTDTIDAVYRPPGYQSVALIDELSQELELGSGSQASAMHADTAAVLSATAKSHGRRPLLGSQGINDDISLERRDELIVRVVRPFFSQLSIYAFESTYALVPLEWETCSRAVLKDLFDERTIVKAP